jgi:hypothetical protein
LSGEVQLNDKFPLAHPSIIQFASVIQQEKFYSQLIRSIQVGVQKEEEVLECEFPSGEECWSWYLDIVLDEPDINSFFENHDIDNELGASYVDVSDTMDVQEENARHDDEMYHFDSYDSWMYHLSAHGDDKIDPLYQNDLSDFDADLAILSVEEKFPGVSMYMYFHVFNI